MLLDNSTLCTLHHVPLALTYLPPSSTHESHVCQLPVPSQLPVNKRVTLAPYPSSFTPEYCGDIVGEVVPSEGESVGGLLEERRRRSSGSHVGVLPLTVESSVSPSLLPDLSAAWLSRLSIPARPVEPRLSDPTRTTFLTCHTTHNTEGRRAIALLHWVNIG